MKTKSALAPILSLSDRQWTDARQAYLFDEHDSPIGSIVGIEKQKRDANNNLVSESFHGTWQFPIPDDSHTIARSGVYSGTFSTGARVKDIRGQ